MMYISSRIETAGHTQRRSCSEIFLEEWSTSGRIRPNLKFLLEFLVKAKLLRAAEYVSSKILNGRPPERPKDGPLAPIDVTINDNHTSPSNSEDFKSTFCADQLDTNFSTTLNNKNRFGEIELPYCYLNSATNGFSDLHLIGAGGFGKVYKATLNNCIVAIKKMDKVFEDKDFEQYLNEIDIVIKCKHENLLPLLAISYDEQPCVIYEYMENGSLLDCLKCLNDKSPLNWILRMKLGLDVANGLVYLHTAFENPIIHRDIKTANILLDDKFVAKIGDFGLTRIGDHTMTSVVSGTSAYMSPEAFRGDISVKMDVFSFAVVLLELLTGLAPYDTSRTGCDLLTHIYDIECPVKDLLDKRAGNWDLEIGTKVYDLAILCAANKTQRPFMHGQGGVLECLKKIQADIKICC
ncbi:interleukin-1 receptor-associated kinase 4-like isoform X2 [Adelges cooleyi]|uniref:interleukin-1 receptor-associated kinase 4-like isoform X2 n=1 Tax=Adelges cooleyi TaxID=133065 RepID=UPI00217FF890|nr:interleukin-1 receptor-associated kinase 4-like isoform X2 [Adelges cooleyi]